MTDGHDRMMKHHPRTGEAHDFTDLFTHVWFIAVHFAVGAKGLCLHKGTFVRALSGVGIQRSAVGAERLAAVLFAAVDGDHQRNGFFFPLPFALNIH